MLKSHLITYAIIYDNTEKELQTNISNNNKLRRMVNVPSVSQFSRKNANRDYRWYDELTDNDYKFITRQVSNASVEELKSTYVENDLIFDYEITMETEHSRNKTRHTYREILTFDENEEEVRLVINILEDFNENMHYLLTG